MRNCRSRYSRSQADSKGRPLRDEESTTYVGAIETADDFGKRIYADSPPRTAPWPTLSLVTVPLGSGILPSSTSTVRSNLYHARSYIRHLANAVYGTGTKKATAWTQRRLDKLDDGNVDAYFGACVDYGPPLETKEEIRKTIGYLKANKQRMRYADFRKQELFVGSGVVEAGCKTIAGRRLKQSGMRWTLRGANAIIALRCCQLSGRWEKFWDARSAV